MLTKNPSTILGSALVLFSGGMLYLVSQFSEAAEEFRALSPKFFPEILSWALLFLGAVILLQGVRRPAKLVFETRPTREALIRAVLFVLLVGGNLYLLPRLGFAITSALFMMLSQHLLGERKFLLNILRTALFVGALYYLFSILLRVPLPIGPWGY